MDLRMLSGEGIARNFSSHCCSDRAASGENPSRVAARSCVRAGNASTAKEANVKTIKRRMRILLVRIRVLARHAPRGLLSLEVMRRDYTHRGGSFLCKLPGFAFAVRGRSASMLWQVT